VVYDPNFRRRLTTPERARQVLAEIAPHCALVTPSCPGDSAALLDTTDPAGTVAAARKLGAGAVAVTSGSDRVLVGWSGADFAIPVPVNEHAVDATGAGDVFAGTAAARIALGDPLPSAIRLAVAAASLSVAGRGGTGRIPTLAETRQLANIR
jgi:2-dehydro-3-deoxygluconokinase